MTSAAIHGERHWVHSAIRDLDGEACSISGRDRGGAVHFPRKPRPWGSGPFPPASRDRGEAIFSPASRDRGEAVLPP